MLIVRAVIAIALIIVGWVLGVIVVTAGGVCIAARRWVAGLVTLG